jgi:hypothetical protein
MAGSHITNNNFVQVDLRTGLSCHWFWLGEPQVKILGTTKEMSYEEIVEKILAYRELKFPDVQEMAKNVKNYPFGGCGGNVETLFKTYIKTRTVAK